MNRGLLGPEYIWQKHLITFFLSLNFSQKLASQQHKSIAQHHEPRDQTAMNTTWKGQQEKSTARPFYKGPHSLCIHSAVPALGEGEWGASPAASMAQAPWQMAQEKQPQQAFGKVLAQEEFH